MNKINKLTIFNLILFIFVATICVVQIFIEFSGMNTKEFCVLCFLVAIAISLMVKGVIFKSSNSIWFALIIFSYAVFLFLSTIYGELMDFYAVAFLVLPAIFAVPVSILFKELVYIKIAVFLVAISVPILLFNLKIIGVLLFVFLLIAFGICGYLLQMFIGVRKK